MQTLINAFNQLGVSDMPTLSKLYGHKGSAINFEVRLPNGDVTKIFDDNNGIPDSIIHDDRYFQDFKLQFAKTESGEKNPLEGLKYSTLNVYKSNFEYMTVRCMAIRQNEPKEDDSSVFEIFRSIYHLECKFLNWLAIKT